MKGHRFANCASRPAKFSLPKGSWGIEIRGDLIPVFDGGTKKIPPATISMALIRLNRSHGRRPPDSEINEHRAE